MLFKEKRRDKTEVMGEWLDGEVPLWGWRSKADLAFIRDWHHPLPLANTRAPQWQDFEEDNVEEWCVKGCTTYDTKVPGLAIISHVSAMRGAEAVPTSDLKSSVCIATMAASMKSVLDDDWGFSLMLRHQITSQNLCIKGNPDYIWWWNFLLWTEVWGLRV